MSLPREQGEFLTTLLTQGGEQLQYIQEEFINAFPDYNDRLNALAALSSLVLEDLADSTAKVIIVWLIIMSFATNLSENPFQQILAYVYQSSASSTGSGPISRENTRIAGFTAIVASEGSDQLSTLTPVDILTSEAVMGSESVPDIFADVQSPINRTKFIVIDDLMSGDEGRIKTKEELILSVLLDPPPLGGYMLPFIREPPNFLEVNNMELLHTSVMSLELPPLLYDQCNTEFCLDEYEIAAMLMPDIDTAAFTIDESDLIIRILDDHPELLDGLAINKESIHGLIEVNPIMIAHILMRPGTNYLSNDIQSELYSMEHTKSVYLCVSTMLIADMPETDSRFPPEFCEHFIEKSVNSINTSTNHEIIAQKTKNLVAFLRRLEKAKFELPYKSLLELGTLEVKLTRKGVKNIEDLRAYVSE